jgi:hypothetical protein
VPLSTTAWALLNKVHRVGEKDWIFTIDGKRPVANFSGAKSRLDKLMVEALGYKPAPWVLHDLRRVVRSQLSALKVPENVAEMVIGHGKKGLARVYDQHAYLDEMREALQAWANKLWDTVSCPQLTQRLPINT